MSRFVFSFLQRISWTVQLIMLMDTMLISHSAKSKVATPVCPPTVLYSIISSTALVFCELQ